MMMCSIYYNAFFVLSFSIWCDKSLRLSRLFIYFKDIVYNVTQSTLNAVYQDRELVLFPCVQAKTEQEHVENIFIA